MTSKERQDAVIELRDMAYEHERRAMHMDGDTLEKGQRIDRARMLRAVAEEIEAIDRAKSAQKPRPS